MRTVAHSQRERDCGLLVCQEDDPEIRVRNEDGTRRASFAGLLRCGHVWTCAPCSQRIRARQAKRITDAVQHLGGQWAMLTLTIRHHAGMGLKDTIRGVKGAWRRVRQRRDCRDVWKAVALAPVTTCEVKWSEANGWHPHLHVAFKMGRKLRPEEVETFARCWREAVVAQLGPSARPNDEHGIVWSSAFDADKEADRALYVAKLGLALEVADPGLVKGTSGGRSPFDIADAAAAERAVCVKAGRRWIAEESPMWLRWREYHLATKGLHVLQLSPEAADAARQAALIRGEEAILRAEEEGKEYVEPVNIQLPTSVVRAMRVAESRWPTVFHSLLVEAEMRGRDGVRRWLALHFPDSLSKLLDTG